jgi:hypothetical protein
LPEREANLQAAFKVAKRATLSDIIITGINAKRFAKLDGELKPQLSDEYRVQSKEESKLEILCHHHLGAATADTKIADFDLEFTLVYDLAGGDPLVDSDLEAFANANGAYNSWPFAREMFNSLSLRLGLPAFVLPTLLLVSPKATPAVTHGEPKVEEIKREPKTE